MCLGIVGLGFCQYVYDLRILSAAAEDKFFDASCPAGDNKKYNIANTITTTIAPKI